MAKERDNGAGLRSGKGAPGKGAEVREFRAAGRGKKCPICGGPVATATRPFCSKRCADLDLGRWLREDYRLPTDEPADAGGDMDPDGGGVPPEPAA